MKKRLSGFLRRYGPTILTLVALVLFWQWAVVFFKIKKFVLPSPVQVFESLFNPTLAAKNHWWRHIGATGVEILGSFALTVVVGVALAVLIAWSPIVDKLLTPVIVLFNSIPKIALAPLFLLWFGYGVVPNMLVALLVAFFPVVINAATGMKEVDEDLLDLVRYLNASKMQVFLKIRIPNSLGHIFSGVKISATMCVVGSIVGEFIASKKGLGYLLRDAQAFIDMPTMFACLIVLAVMGLLFFGLVSLLEWLLMPWERRAKEVA